MRRERGEVKWESWKAGERVSRTKWRSLPPTKHYNRSVILSLSLILWKTIKIHEWLSVFLQPCRVHVFARPSILLDFILSHSSHRSKRYHVQLIKSGSLATLNTKQLLHNCGKFLLSTLFKHLLSVLNDFQGSQPNCSFETISIFHAPVTPSVTWGAKLTQWISNRNMNSSCLQNI